MKKKILLITVNRSDYGIQKNLIKILNQDKNIDFGLLVTGTHLDRKYGYTINEIYDDGIKIKKKIKLNQTNYNSDEVITILSDGIKINYKFYKSVKPDLIIILGDRYEMLSAAIPCIFLKIPIAHIHGGEKTEGSFDDRFRNILTEISSLHFTCHDIYKKRVIEIKNSKKGVYNFGSLSVENIKNFNFKSRNDIIKKFNINFRKKNILITYHPETNNTYYSIKSFNNILEAVSKFKEINFFFTSPAPDPGNYDIIKSIMKFCKNNNNAFYIKSLGRDYYFSLLNNVDAVLGNSSSGIIEAPSFKIFTINIGSRQNGREKSKSIIDCADSSSEIVKKIKKIYTFPYKKKIKKNYNIFYKPNTSKNIISELKNFLKLN